MKFYAVKKGRTPGIYRTWEECKKQVDGFSGAEYKSFTKITDATDYLGWNEPAENNELIKKDQDTLQHAIEKIKKQSKKKSESHNYYGKIYTDGGSRNTGVHAGGHVNKTDKAAWAYRIEWEGQEVHGSGGEYGATNNKMELTALINAFKKVIELGINDKKLKFVLDSRYVLDGINKGWIKSWKKRGWKKANGPLINKEEWQEIDRLLPNFPDSVFKWTKGHAKNKGNEFVDHLLNQYMDEKMQRKVSGKKVDFQLVFDFDSK